jgi:hypothetical protein
MVCELLGIPPSQVGEIDPYDIAFLKAGLIWKREDQAEMMANLF